ncbi:MAG: response regulator [Spirochaetaceae bacterium]|jgi:signal transduction histidine kinase/DNA-binding NarL/FixJ family response regulator/HPt (histidine-containing phosphotransfer) domain-containing protein/ferredoxin|nr:response regulator [Spirochaetaceae bacterium]
MGDIIGIHEELCIACGRCIAACTRAARYFVDDSEEFFEQVGEKNIVAIAAPSVAALFEDRFRFNGYLHSLGVRAVFDGAFGGELSMFAYRDYLASSPKLPVIASNCPVLVTYCKIYKPELLPHFAKVHSPTIFTALMIRHFFPQYNDCDIAAITSCIAKKREFEVEGYIKYNITTASIKKYLRRNRIDLRNFSPKPYEGPAAFTGVQFSVQSGVCSIYKEITGKTLRKTRAYSGNPAFIYFNEINVQSENPPVLVDCHNCLFGCYRGTATGANNETIETQESRISKINKKIDTWAVHIQHKLNLRKYYKKGIYPLRDYLPGTHLRESIKIPSEYELRQIYVRMRKANASDTMNCQACGYETCRDMAIAIYNGLNKEQNCRHYLISSEEEKAEELKKQTKIAQDLADKAMTASEAKAAFLANMSHEIRTPMNAIIGMSTLFRTDNLDETQRKYLDDIKKVSSSLLVIINDILDFSKIEAGKIILTPVHFNLHSLVDNICSLSKFLIDNKSYTFENRIASNVPTWMYGDEIRLRQVFTNLISNAIKYTNEGCVQFSIEKTEDDLGNIFIVVQVSDTGIGIKPEDLEKLFSPFQRVDEKKTRAIKGTGLGLVICKQLVELMGGEINVASEYQKGSTFTVKLPFIPGDETMAETNESARSFVRVKDSKEVNVLVVDDAPVNLVVALGFLETHNINADKASGGREALQKVQQKRYDLIFMDHMMPDMDGIEVTAIIRKDHPDIPVIALTANAISGVEEQFYKNGMNGFLSKPIEQVALNAVLAKWLPADKIELLKKHNIYSEPIKSSPESPRLKNDPQETSSNALSSPLKEALQTLNGIDFETGIKHSGGSEKIYRMALSQFSSDFPSLLAEIETYFEAGDWKNYTIKIHAVKSAFANIGCKALAGRARELEAASKKAEGLSEQDAAAAAISAGCPPGFFAEAKTFWQMLQTLPALHEKSRPQTAVSRAALNEMLNALKSACREYDMQRIDALTAELAGLTVDSETDAVIARIILLLNDVSYTDAIKEIDGLL